MFHSAGYFRGVSCPFFEHGLCHRPHCHYRHARSSSKTRPRKPPQLKARRKVPSPTEQQTAQPGTAPLQGSEEGSQQPASGADERVSTETTAKDGGAGSGVDKAPPATVGGVVNFYGSSLEVIQPTSGESCDPSGESCDPLGAVTVLQDAEETVFTSDVVPLVPQTPIYAPEKCLARESAYSGELSSPVALGSNVEVFEDLEPPSRSESPEVPSKSLPLLPEHEGGDPAITEQEIFGSSDELSSGEDDASAAEVIPVVQESPENLVRIQEEFVRATELPSSSSTRDPQTDSRKRKATDSAELSTSMKQQRVAHKNALSASALVRTVLQSKPKATSNFAAALDLDALYMGKKRTVKPASAESGTVVKRPRLSLTVNAKIPTALRQKFLDSFIDEHLKMTSDPQQAYGKALNEERQLFERSSRRMLYLNLSTIALKKLRAQAEHSATEQRKRSDARVRAQREGRGEHAELSPCTSQDVISISKKSEKATDGGRDKGKSSKVHDSKKGEGRKSAVKLGTADTGSSKTEREETDIGGVVLPDSRGLTDSKEMLADDQALFKCSHFYSCDEVPPAAEQKLKGKASMKTGKSVSRERRKQRKTSSVASHEDKKLPRARGGEELPHARSRCKTSSSGGSDLVADLFGSSDSDHAAVSSPGSSSASSSDTENPGMSFESILGSMDEKVMRRGTQLTRQKAGERKVKTKGSKRLGRPETSRMRLGSDQEPVKTVSEDRPGRLPSPILLETPPGPSQQARVGRVSAPSTEMVRAMHRFVKKRLPDRDKREIAESDCISRSTERMSTSSLESEPMEVRGTPEDPVSLHVPAGPFINLTKIASSHPKRNPSLSAAAKKKKHPRKKIAPPPYPTPKPTFTIFKKKENYLLTEEQLVENGYPRPTEQEGVASINRTGETPPDIQPVGPNAMRHRCCRCNKPFIIYNSGQYQTVEECVYHFGRLVKTREYGEGVVSMYTCCQERRDSSGCQVAKMHVTSGTRPLRDSGYVRTTPPPSLSSSHPIAYALDCEMCYTTAGLQLTRVSVVDVELKPVFESLVKPSYPIVDYNTRFSGLTAEDFVAVETTLEEVQQQLLHLFHEDTILLGHSLESDLRTLKLIHSSVVDTAIVFPHRKGPPYKRALRTLMAEYIHKFIQDSVDGGHDSLEDSRACMELMLWKVKADLQKTTRRVSND